MKNRIQTTVLVLITLFTIVACAPQEKDDYALNALPQASELSFTATPTASKANVVELKNESKIPGVVTWNLGNGITVKGESAKAEYPFKGTYVVAMTLYTTGGAVTITKELSIAADDMSLLDTPMYNALTGGAANLTGKTWVFDQYHSGHFALGPAGSGKPEWWSCPPNGKLGSSLYSQEFTFTQVGVKLQWKNNGYIYTNDNGRKALGITDVVENPGGTGDFDVKYVPKANYTFTLNETDKTLKLSDGSFFGHYTGASTFQIMSLTNDELYVRCISVVESGNSWWYRLIPKEKNVKPVVPLKAVSLKEDFESVKLSVNFKREDMGQLDFIYSNPAPVPVNQSKMVYLYERTSSFYSNISYAATGYKFDLTTLNKVRMKIFIPSYNDYTTPTTVAGDWIVVNTLQKQVVVKLQNSELGGNAWQTQVEVAKVDLTTDKWLSLEFDFSPVKDRQDLDQIVIQFGAEGHAAPGLFFFDDFSFDK